jgi:hypothetical protein
MWTFGSLESVGEGDADDADDDTSEAVEVGDTDAAALAIEEISCAKVVGRRE